MFSLVIVLGSGLQQVTTGPRSLFSFFLQGQYFRWYFCCPNNAVLWITSNLTFTPIRFTYSLKLTDMAPRAPVTNTTMTFHVRQTFANSSFNSWYFSIFSSSLSFTLSSPGMATSIMTTSHSILNSYQLRQFLVF